MTESDFLLFPLDEVEKYYHSKGFAVRKICNNYNVNGDRKLVTNIKIEGDVCFITYSLFIFDL